MTEASDPMFAELKSLAKSMTVDDRQLVAPPGALWERIAADAFGPDPDLTADPVSNESSAQVIDMQSARRAPRGTWVFAAAAAVVALVFAAVITLAGGNDGDVVGTADLAALVEDGGSGSAELLDDDGSLRLDLELADTPATDDGYLEVWLIESVDPLRLVSLGPVDESGVYDLPAGLDPEQFRVVDVSREHFDGEAAHSGDSILRGELQI